MARGLERESRERVARAWKREGEDSVGEREVGERVGRDKVGTAWERGWGERVKEGMGREGGKRGRRT